MDANASAIVAKTLDALSYRYQAIAQNIANAGSVGYRPVRVDFEADLRSAADRGPDALRGLTFAMRTDPSYREGSEMRIDLEIAAAAQTSMRYSALVDMLGRRMAISRAMAGIGGQ